MRNAGDKGMNTVKKLLEESGSPKWVTGGEMPHEGQRLWGETGREGSVSHAAGGPLSPFTGTDVFSGVSVNNESDICLPLECSVKADER